MAKTGKPKSSGMAPRRESVGGGTGGMPEAPPRVGAEQLRESDERLKARDADSAKSVKKSHTGGR